ARRAQHDLADTLGLQVQGETGLVTPLAGVVDDQGIVDAVLRVVDVVRRIGVDEVDDVAVGDDTAVFLVDAHRSLEGTVYRVIAQQVDALLQVAVATATHHDSSQAHDLAIAGLFQQQAGHKAADAAEAVQHHVHRALDRLVLAVDQVGQFLAHPGLDVDTLAALGLVHVAHGELAEVNLAGAEVQAGQR